jgi:hypothetical protein
VSRLCSLVPRGYPPGQGAVAIVAPGGGQAGRMGRRHLTPEQKSDLRGKRYNREKKAEGRPAGKLPENQGETVQRLGWQPTISVTSIVSM